MNLGRELAAQIMAQADRLPDDVDRYVIAEVFLQNPLFSLNRWVRGAVEGALSSDDARTGFIAAVERMLREEGFDPDELRKARDAG